MPVKVNFRHSSIKKVICCLPEIQIRLGVLYFYLRNPATLFLLTASSFLKESLREFCFIFSSQRLRMCFLAVQQTAHPPLTKLFSFSKLPRMFPVMHILTSCYPHSYFTAGHKAERWAVIISHSTILCPRSDATYFPSTNRI